MTTAQAAWGASMLDALPLAAWVVRLADTRVCQVNQHACELLGRSASELDGADASGLATSPEDMAYWMEASLGAPGVLNSDTLVATGDGQLRAVHRCITPLAPASGMPTHALVTMFDRQDQVQAERERETLITDLQATLESTADGLLVTDQGGRIRAFNQRFARMWNLPDELLQGEDSSALDAFMQQRVSDPHRWVVRLAQLHASPSATDSERVELANGVVLERVTRPLVRNGVVRGRVWSYRDLTERLAAEERIETLATTDALTGLPNRRRFSEHVEKALSAARRGQAKYALLLIDLDHFRRINDTLGHAVGDRVLVQVAQRVGACLRQGDLLARIGGDQFGVLLECQEATQAEAGARRIVGTVGRAIEVSGTAFTLTCSVGIAMAPSHGLHVDDLLRHAEAAMQHVKSSGRANVRLHQAREEGDRRAHMQLDHAMRQALVANRFRLAYQPQVDLADGRITGAEALLRWRDPELGDVPPARFIPVAEESGFIIDLGDWVLGQAVLQAAQWRERGLTVPVAVNVSALQFRQAHFVERVAQALRTHRLPAALLELELTESILVRDADEALARLRALARLGVRMSIDDFGTGYSSLAYLKRFPIGKLKIDRSFVQGLPQDARDVGIVKAMLQVAQALDMKVVAEGVETEAQRDFLRGARCHEMQGYLHAAPMDPVSFESHLLEHSAAPAAPAGKRTRPEHAHIRLVSP